MKKKLIIAILTLIIFIPITFASDLPEPIAKRLKKEFPGVNIRFDALIELPDRTQYLPIFPLDQKK